MPDGAEVQLDIEVMQKAIDIGAVAERYMVAGDLDGASVLVDMADMYVAMARELRIGNRRMTRSTRSGTVSPVYLGNISRKTVTWDITEPLPAPEPFTGGRPQPIGDAGPVEAAEAFEGGLTGSEVPLGQEASFPVQEVPPTGSSSDAFDTEAPAGWADNVVIDGGETWDTDTPLADDAPGVPLTDDTNRS